MVRACTSDLRPHYRSFIPLVGHPNTRCRNRISRTRMSSPRSTPDFSKLRPKNETASRRARSSSAKCDTRPELLLRRELWRRGVRYRLCLPGLPGRPDIVLPGHRLVIFCDGDFWHGRNLDDRLRRLGVGHNAEYWVQKIRSNVDRDRRQDVLLREAGWKVLRLWETDIRHSLGACVDRVLTALGSRCLASP